MSHSSKEFKPLNIAVLTISDTRTIETDTSGQFLVDALIAAGHKLHERAIVIDDPYKIRALVSKWIAEETCQVVISTGGTGFSDRDFTPQAIIPLLDKNIEGFGELFRSISHEEIGTSTVQSRAVAGMANHTAVFCLPGSTGACRTGWNKILEEQLDSRHKPCNFVMHLG
ncbi:molybdenum cofactor biosynthesis protein B [Celerinatantimonas sp. YJH-8]|uniref:molybdenum cofactor biosynthesis protein B n=1 Tax=Celerinatantimonas sp. YJH-8 TaxID=3228714 RepID=UPI0038C434F0